MAPPTKAADWPTAYTCQALKFTIYLAGAFVTTPIQRIFEADVCRNYYRDADPGAIDSNEDVLEELCKVSPVQQGVSDIRGLQSGVSLIPSLLATLIYLALLQRINKKHMLLLNIIGFVLMDVYYLAVLYFYNFFNPRWIAATSILSFIGGGFPVFNSILPALIAESVPQDSLSSFQLYTSAASLLIRTIGSSISLVMMKTSLWFPVVLGIGLQAALIPFIFIVFRGAIFSNNATGTTSRMSRGDYAHLAIDDEEIEMSNASHEYDSETSTPVPPRSSATSSSAISRFACQHGVVLVQCLLPCTAVIARETAESIRYILPFWMSTRYHWELREVGWVRLGESVFSVLIVSALPRFAKTFLQHPSSATASRSLPTVANARSGSDYDENAGEMDERKEDTDEKARSTTTTTTTTTTKPDTSSMRRDLALAKFCILLTALGTLLLGLSWYRVSAIVSLAVFAGGTGFQDAYFSYLAGSMPEKDKSSLASVYMILSMATLGGYEIGGSLTSAIYSTMLNWGEGSWATSVPVWFGVIWFGVAWWLLRLHR